MGDRPNVLVAMSGGVDSSVAALLLQGQGFDIAGCTMKLYSNEAIGVTDRMRTCCSLDDIVDARRVADRLGFDHHVFNFGELFQKTVMAPFVQEYLEGRTPNPCINCNRYIKFSKLLERAEVLGFDYIATGHYARVLQNPETGRYELHRAKDVTKDQTYVLYAMTQHELAHTLFPLGGLLKTEVRALAEQYDLVNAKKPESQDICFVPDGDYARYIENAIGAPAVPGEFIHSSGRVIGKHRGIVHYTIGQRRGIGISAEHALYVVDKDAMNNTVTLGSNEDLFRDALIAYDLNWITIPGLEEPMEVTAKIRYGPREKPARITPQENGTVLVQFDRPLRAISPGQAVVFYAGEAVVGGGTIRSLA